MAKNRDTRGGRGRFKTGRDAQDQFMDVEKAQRAIRKGQRKGAIDLIDKSSKRLTLQRNFGHKSLLFVGSNPHFRAQNDTSGRSCAVVLSNELGKVKNADDAFKQFG